MADESYEFIGRRGAEVEAKLKELGAVGNGLRQLAGSIESKLPEQVMKDIRALAHVRNLRSHDHTYRPTQQELQRYDQRYLRILEALDRIEVPEPAWQEQEPAWQDQAQQDRQAERGREDPPAGEQEPGRERGEAKASWAREKELAAEIALKVGGEIAKGVGKAILKDIASKLFRI